MAKLIVLTGVSGSGKSTMAKNLVHEFDANNQTVNYLLSTDSYWVRPDGIYDWNPKLLGRAHEHTYKKFERYVLNDKYGWIINHVILDNTNLRFDEFRKYVELAIKSGWEVEILEPETEWRYNAQVLAEKNTHGVPLATIERMLAKRESIEILRQKLENLKCSMKP